MSDRLASYNADLTADVAADNSTQTASDMADPVANMPIDTVMALDFGVAKMGIALGNTLTQSARPLMQFAMNNGQPDWDKLLTLIADWQVNTIVIGLPVNMDGTPSPLSLRCHKFARRLNHQLQARHYRCAIILVDERLTSKEAKAMAWEYGLIRHEYEPIDSIASAILLGSWLRGDSGTGVRLP